MLSIDGGERTYERRGRCYVSTMENNRRASHVTDTRERRETSKDSEENGRLYRSFKGIYLIPNNVLLYLTRT